MVGIRVWNFLMGILTLFALFPYYSTLDKALADAHLVALDSIGEHRFLISFGYQGLAMGLYCLWGAIDSAKAVEALRFLTLYMACVSFGRGMAALDNYSDLLGQPMVYFTLDTLITIIGAVILVKYLRSQKTLESK
jgi:hypothetical protein|tara:strand:+ start:25851 stop:26258 length:408 start_codon:yes stop_codon:yes gene_type:complete